VIQYHAFNGEVGLRKNKTNIRLGGTNLSPYEGIPRAERYPWSETTVAELRRQNVEVGGAFIEEVPEICMKLGGNPIYQTGRAHKSDGAWTVERESQQPVEAYEVIQMPVRDKNFSYTQQFTRSERPKVAKIKQHGALAEFKINEETRIPEGLIDQPGTHKAAHDAPSRKCIAMVHDHRLDSVPVISLFVR
jgi:hypothetical protein